MYFRAYLFSIPCKHTQTLLLDADNIIYAENQAKRWIRQKGFQMIVKKIVPIKKGLENYV